MIDLSRKQFEEYYNDWGGFGCEYCLHHRMSDSYNIPDVAKAWRHWQASRECLVIELPPRIGVAPIGGDGIQEFIDCNGGYLYSDLVMEALTGAGVKTK